MRVVFTSLRRRIAVPALAAVLGVGMLLGAGEAMAAAKADAKLIHPEEGWTFEGPFGRYDKAALQRGYQVYRNICAACHSMKFLHYRNLSEAGGPGFTEAEVKALAAEFQCPAPPDEFGQEVDEFGQPLTQPCKPSDKFVNPYQNEQAAKAANGGALPPDLSVITKARHGTSDYVYSLLQGYVDAPEDVEVQPGAYYNKYYPGGQLAMGPQLYEGLIQYDDGTEATIEQMAYDITQFLSWAAEPKLEQRKQLGLMVMIYLLIFAALLYASYRRVWRDVDH